MTSLKKIIIVSIFKILKLCIAVGDITVRVNNESQHDSN